MKFTIPSAFREAKIQAEEEEEKRRRKIEEARGEDDLTQLEEELNKRKRRRTQEFEAQCTEWEQARDKWIQYHGLLDRFTALVCLGMWLDSAPEAAFHHTVRKEMRKRYGIEGGKLTQPTASNELYLKRGPRTKEMYVGKRYGRLIGLHAAAHDHNRALLIRCRCDCGSERTVRLAHLLAGKVYACESCMNSGNLTSGKSNTIAAVFNQAVNQLRDNPVRANEVSERLYNDDNDVNDVNAADGNDNHVIESERNENNER